MKVTGMNRTTEQRNLLRIYSIDKKENSRTEAVGFYEKLGYVADPKQITGTGAFQCIMTEKQL